MYPEISCRKYCQEEYWGLDRKQNREFIGLPLHKKQLIDLITYIVLPDYLLLTP